jgi:hypothetical protein
MPPTRSAEQFTEQATALEIAHNQGSQTFEAAVHGALAFVVDYPNQALEEDVERTDSRLQVAFTAALTGLRGAIADKRLRRDLGQTIDRQLSLVESGEPQQHTSEARLNGRILPLMVEALQDSFPDEVGVPSDELKIEDQPELEAPDAEEFGELVTDIFSQAKKMMKIIQATNTTKRHLEINEYFRGGKELIFHKGRKRVTTIGVTGSGKHYFVEQKTRTGKGKDKTVQTLRVEQASSKQESDDKHGYPQSLNGHLAISKQGNKSGRRLKQKQNVKVANSIFAQMRQELTRRRQLFNEKAVEDTEIDDILGE